MTLILIYKTIEQYIESVWNYCDYSFGGAGFGEGSQPLLEESWVLFQVKPGETEVLEIGLQGIGVRQGEILADVFSPLDGMRRGAELAGLAESLLRRKNLSGLYLGEPKSIFMEKNNQRWLHHRVAVPFTTSTGE
ncbi:MAG: hypothetical protein OEY59_01000 [Deltaproteobacteria bacterium]|nr:hypothetical protein [Deltaproteobacteria bacterium]